MAEIKKIDTSKSKLVMEADKDTREKWINRITDHLRNLSKEREERKKVNDVRRDFFLGVQNGYTNIIGLTRKQKQGHANATFNYAGKSCVKIYYGLANQPPNLKVPALPVSKEKITIEGIRDQAVEDFQDSVFNFNRFWFGTWPRAVMNQVVVGAGAIKVYYDFSKKMIKTIQKENVDNLYVGWSGEDASSYSFVIDREQRTVESVEREFNIDIDPALLKTDLLDVASSSGSHQSGYEYSSPVKSSTQAQTTPSGRTDLPKCWVTNYTDDVRDIILVNDEVVQYVEHDWGFNPWVIIPNIYVPGKPWGMSDIDFLIDPQIEYNEVSNDTRDFIRAATNIKYKALNMPDFDPESIKTGSGQVIFVQGPDSDFSAIPQPVNTFPADQYLNRIKTTIHDMGVPQVSYGSGLSNSGRSKAMDYQSVVDIIEDKRRAWNLAFQEICERVQKLGYKYFPAEYWTNPDTNEFEFRPVEMDWNDIVPLTNSEKITNIINKYQTGLISLQSALHEAGYKDVDREIEILKTEESDPVIAAIRNRAIALIPGIRVAQREATMENAELQQDMAQDQAAENPQAGPMLTQSQNQGQTQPMAVPGNSTSFSSPEGFIQRTRQNLEAQS